MSSEGRKSVKLLGETVAALLHCDGALVVHHVRLDPQLQENKQLEPDYDDVQCPH